MISEHVCEVAKMTLIRDYLLCLIQENEIVQRKEFAEEVKLPAEVVKELLSKVAVYIALSDNNNNNNNNNNNTNQGGWKLKLDSDYEFIER